MLNRGALALRERFSEHGKQADCMRALQAHGLQIDAPWTSRVFSGKKIPDTKARAAIEDLFGIGWRLWDEQVEESDAHQSGEHSALEAPDSTGTEDT